MIQSSQYTVFENRLDKPCPLELDGGDLCNGSTSSVGCVHRIAWATAHSAALDEGPCAAFRCFRASHLPPPPQTQALRRFHRCHTLSPPRPAPLQPVCGVCDGAFSHGRWGGGCRHPQVPSAPVACFLLLCVLGPRGSWLIGTPYQILRESWVISNESWMISRGSCAISPKSHLAATNTHTRQLSPFQCPGTQACGARVLACSSPGARIPVRSTLQS